MITIRSKLAVLLLVSLCAPAWADDDAKLVRRDPLPAREAAEAVRKAHAAKDSKTVKEHARTGKPGPWSVADELCAMGAHDAARTLAAAATQDVADGLGAVIDALEMERPDSAAREAFTSGLVAAEKKDHATALRAFDEAGEEAVGIFVGRVAEQRGLALRGLHKLTESNEAFEAWRKHAETLGWQGGIARAYGALGFNAYRMGNPQQAFEHWKRAATLSAKLGFTLREATVLNNLGLLLDAVGQRKPAIQMFGKALTLFRSRNDAEGVARVLGNRALINWNSGDFAGALALLDRSLKIQQRVGLETEATRTLTNVASVLLESGKNAESLARFEQILERLKDTGADHNVATVQLNMGIALEKLGRMDESTASTKQAIATFERIGAKLGLAQATGNLAGNYERLGQSKRAIPLREKALAIVDGLDHKRESIQQRAALAMLYAETGGFERAETLLIEAAERLGGPSGSPQQALVEQALGHLRTRQGRSREALEHTYRAHAIFQKLGDRLKAAASLQNAGAIHSLRGDFARGLTAYDRAGAVLESGGDKATLAIALSNKATILTELGRVEEAIALLERSLELVEAIGDGRQLAYTTGNLASAYMQSGDYEAAKPLLARSRELNKAAGLPIGEANAVGNMATLLHRQGKADEAVPTYEQAIDLHRKARNSQGEAQSMNSLGALLADGGKHAEATALFDKAMAIAADNGYYKSTVAILGNLAAARRATGDLAAALDAARGADAAMRRIYGRLSDEGAARARGVHAAIYRTAIRAARDAQDPAGVFEFMERGRAAALLEALGGRTRLQSVVLGPELREAEAAARQAETNAAEAYRRARRRGRLKETRARKAEWESAQAATLAVVERIQREAKAAAGVVYAEPRTLADAQASLAKDRALVLYALMEGRSCALVVTKDAARIVALADQETVSKAAEALLASLEDPEASADKPRDALADLVVQPLALPDSVKRVDVSPSGALCYVPMGLLASDVVVSSLPSVSAGMRTASRADASRSRVLALGDPSYGAPSGRGSGVRSGFDLTPLPATRKEAMAVGDVVLLGAEATEDGFRKALGAQDGWRAVHFACHGLVHPSSPLLSALALTPGEGSDGFLTALEVMGTVVNADLVVLSACETGKGKFYDGEGIVGLTRSFMVAGAPRVICSLWKVDDEATQALVLRFYELWTLKKPGSKPMDAATALKAAQEYVRTLEKEVVDKEASRKARRTITKKVRPWAHPYYWAAWVLWSSGRA